MGAMKDCVVLGAGLMGRLLAHALVRAGHRVTVHEAQGPDAQGAAARVAASMLAPLAESAITELPVVRMGQHSLQRWPGLIAELPLPVFFQRAGTVIVWHRQDAPEAKRFADKLRDTQTQWPEAGAPQSLQSADLAQLEPSLADKFSQGLWLPEEGQLDNRQLLDALLASLERSPARLHWHSPQSLAAAEAGHADWVFDCRGLGAKPQWSSLRGVRGEVLRLHAPEVYISRPVRLIHPRYPLYIAPKENGIFVVGATEIETDDLSPASVRSSLELLSAAYSVHSGFAEARILEINVQARPTLPDNLPAIHLPSPGVMQINGLYRHGFLIAPAMLDAAMALMAGDATVAQQFGLLRSTHLSVGATT
jgi:glycine oxidase